MLGVVQEQRGSVGVQHARGLTHGPLEQRAEVTARGGPSRVREPAL